MNNNKEMILRRVSVLGGRLKQQALEEGYIESDIIGITITIPGSGGLPIYDLELVEGSPSSWVEDKFFRRGNE